MASALEFNSYNLKAEFPTKTGTPVIRYLFFLGNATVKEERKANYVQYNPIGRNSSLFSYTGGESRTFTIEYNLSYPIVKAISEVSPGTISNNIKTSEDKAALFFLNQSQDSPYRDSQIPTVSDPDQNKELNTIKLIDYQIDLIRSMLLNNAEDPTVGPALIRLNYGLLYSDIPCVMESYSIGSPFGSTDATTAAQFEYYSTTLIPTNSGFPISMTLKEVRTGDFLKSKFQPRKVTSRDNIVGFEQIIGDKVKSINPGRI